MVERTLAKFAYIIGGLFTIVSALLVFFGWGTLKEIRRRAENTVQNEIQKQAKAADTKITEHVDLVKSAADTKIKEHIDLAQSTFTQQIGVEQEKFREKSDAFGKEIAEMKQRSQERTSELNEFIVSTKQDLKQIVATVQSNVDVIFATTKAEPDKEEPRLPMPSPDEREEKILRLIGQSEYSFRSLFGIRTEAGQKGIGPEEASQCLESLTKKGLIGKTLGRKGGERWYVTEEGRKYLMS